MEKNLQVWKLSTGRDYRKKWLSLLWEWGEQCKYINYLNYSLKTRRRVHDLILTTLFFWDPWHDCFFSLPDPLVSVSPTSEPDLFSDIPLNTSVPGSPTFALFSSHSAFLSIHRFSHHISAYITQISSPDQTNSIPIGKYIQLFTENHLGVIDTLNSTRTELFLCCC